MATFVASVEDQLASNQLQQTTPPKDRRFAILLVSGLTLFVLVIHGYHPYAEDGGLYLAGVKHLLNPALYPHDTAFVLEPARFSLFAPMVAAIVSLCAGFMQFYRMSGNSVSPSAALPIALVILHLATIWITLFAAWTLAARCWTSFAAHSGAVVLLACWFSLPVAGTALSLMDPYLTARSISSPCTLFALAGMLSATAFTASAATRRRGLALWIVSILLAAAMHPLMAAYALGTTLFLACMRLPNPRTRVISAAALSSISIAAAFAIHAFAPPENADYRLIAMTRTYWYPAEWAWYELVGLAAPLVILAVYAWNKSSRTSPDKLSAVPALARMAIVAAATACLTAALFSHATATTHLVSRLQPLRIFHTVYLVMVLLIGGTLGDRLLRHHAWRWATTMLLLGGIMFSAARASFPASPHLELPSTHTPNPWVEAFLWIRNNTPHDALFALDPDYINAPGEDAQCFRAIAERSVLPDYSKDGGEASIAPELTPAWMIGQHAQQRLTSSSTTGSQRVSALTPLGVSWLVLPTATATTFTCPFANSTVKVCRLP